MQFFFFMKMCFWLLFFLVSHQNALQSWKHWLKVENYYHFFPCWHEWVLDIFWHSFVVSTTTSMSKFSDKKKVVWLCSITSWDQFQSCLNLEAVDYVCVFLKIPIFSERVWKRDLVAGEKCGEVGCPKSNSQVPQSACF